MVFEIPELKIILDELYELKAKVDEKKNDLTSMWYNDQQCWQLKGGMALTTYRSNRFFQVKGGIPDAYVGGRKVWSRDSVSEWLSIPDSQLEEYHKKYKTGAKRK